MRGDNIAHRQCSESEFYGLGHNFKRMPGSLRFVIIYDRNHTGTASSWTMEGWLEEKKWVVTIVSGIFAAVFQVAFQLTASAPVVQYTMTRMPVEVFPSDIPLIDLPFICAGKSILSYPVLVVHVAGIYHLAVDKYLSLLYLLTRNGGTFSFLSLLVSR